MDIAHATEKMKEHKKPHSKLINTFGDNQYCWAFPSDVALFAEKVDVHSKQSIKSPILKVIPHRPIALGLCTLRQ